jgi:hypothetical protein
MHAVFGLKQLGLTFELKGGTSLSKGFGIIQRFSEDIDIRIEPFDGLQVDTNPNHEKPAHIESRRVFYEKLRDKIKIPGITTVDRDTTYDDETLRNAGLRLSYETHFGSIAGSQGWNSSGSWLRSDGSEPLCYDFVLDRPVRRGQETSIRRQPSARHPLLQPRIHFRGKGPGCGSKIRPVQRDTENPNKFPSRHYYDIHQLLDVEDVQKFIGTPEYLEHKKKRFKSLDQDVAKSGAFTIEDENVRKQFEVEYSKTAPLYYRGQIPFDTILARIQKDLSRL